MIAVEELKKNAEKIAQAFGYADLSLDGINIKDSYCLGFSAGARENAVDFAKWLSENCIVSRNGFRSSTVPYKWEGEKTNEECYELYLESLKSR